MRLFRLLFARRNPVSDAARQLALKGHANQRARVRAKVDEMRAAMGLEPARWPQ